jgi:succinate-semialdehyde dehydrogenase / glutarate-semialdehyde dehydrogenase
MGGVKDSGSGRRHGRDGIVKYTDAQTIAVQRGLPIGPPAGMSLDRYATAMTTTFKAMKRLPFIK